MDDLVLVAPTMAWEAEILSFKAECMAGDQPMNRMGGLFEFEGVQDWLDFCHSKASEETCPEGSVPDNTWLCVRGDRLVGMLNIRHRLNDFLLQYGGHVGYSIRPKERGKGYARRQLRLGLDKCRELGLPRVLLTCDENNSRSRRTIEGCGGVYEDSRTKPDGAIMRRYWIQLT